MRCEKCGGGCYRRECLPGFRKETLHHYKNPRTGDNWSDQLGMPMPESRRERERIANARGFYYDNVLTDNEKAAIEYRKQVDAGGERLPFNQVISEPTVNVRPLEHRISQWIHAKGPTIPIPGVDCPQEGLPSHDADLRKDLTKD